MNKIVTIQCPCCKGALAIDTEKLFMGNSFECSQCKAKVAIDSQSQQVTSDAFEKINSLKKEDKGGRL